MVRASKLTKRFGSVTAVKDLSFTIEQGEIVGFLGPNGAGKTTTMRMLTGYLAPDEGTVTVDDISLGVGESPARQHIGYMPENNPLYRDFLVRDMLAFAARLSGIPGSAYHEAETFAVTSAGIASVYSRPVSELSKGFRQRVGLACALIHRPKVLVLDEPTEGLDPNQREDIRALIRSLRKDHTILLSTHVLQEATAVATRLLIIHEGRLVADGSTDDLMRRSTGQRIIRIEVEGSQPEERLRALAGVSRVEGETSQGRFRGTLAVTSDAVVQPELSRLVREHGWTIWKLDEQGARLEDVFRSLTRSEKP